MVSRRWLLLIVTIPFGFAALRIASYALWPFGRTIIDKPGAGTGALIGKIIWLLLCGISLAIGHLVSAVAMVPLIAHPRVGCEPFLGHLIHVNSVT